MKKPDTLRAALVAAVPHLADNPDKLSVFADNGTVAAVQGDTLSYNYRYTLSALLLDFAGDPNIVFAAVVEWVKANQRNLIDNRDNQKDGMVFDVEFLNNATADVAIKLKVTESVSARRDADGQLVAEAKPEPKAEWDINGLA